MRRALRIPLLLLVLATAPAGSRAATGTPASAATIARTTRVSYLSGASVYIEAGRLDGLATGDTVTVTRETRSIARLIVTVVSGHHAACDTLVTTDTLRVGDPVRYLARALAVPVSDAAADSAAAAIPGAAADTTDKTVVRLPAAVMAAMATVNGGTAPATRPRARLRGRIGASGLFVDQDAGGGFRRPALDVRVDGRDLRGGFDAIVDMRSDRVVGVGSTPSAEAVARVYRGSLAWHDVTGRWRATAGRQSSTAFSSVSLFDGALLEATGARYGAGLFFGTQPQPVTLGFSSAIAEGGLYASVRSLAGHPRRWSVAFGGVSSTESGQPNRDFLFAQGLYQDARTMLSYTQELDVMRGWRADSSSSTLSPTSAFMMARVQITRAVAVDGGYDGRRDVRLYPDRITPETQFDDRFRQGAWGGLTVEPTHGVRLQGDVRQRFGAVEDRATTWTGSAEVYDIGPWRARARARGSDYTSDHNDNQLWSFGLGANPLPTFHAELSAGTRVTSDRLFDLTARSQWLSLDGDYALLLRWYLVGSFEREHGDDGSLSQSYLGLSWRF